MPSTEDHIIGSFAKEFEAIRKAPVAWTMPVLWGDMDSANHVNNLVYLKWAETARIKLFETMMDTSFKGTKGPILGWQDCKYIFPMTYPDTAVITCSVKEIREDRFFLESRIYSHRHQRIAAICNQSIIPYDYQALKKTTLPEEWRVKLESMII